MPGKIIWIVYLINFAVILTIVCFQKRNPIASMAWIMCLMLFPVIGGIAFLIFGVGINSLTKRKYLQKLEINEKYLLERQKEIIAKDEKSENNLINYFLNSNFLYTENNKVTFFTDAAKKYKSLFDDIENAKESIDILYFIIRNDVIGNKLIDLLAKKAEQGVKVRLLYDGFGSFFTPKKMFDRLRAVNGSEVLEFFPVRFFSLSKMNHRNHRKIVVIDGETAYLGGMNIGDEYANIANNRNLNWRDTHIKVCGEAAECAMRVFAMDWCFSKGEELPIKTVTKKFDTEKKVPMQIVSSGPDSADEEIKCGMIKMINSAKKYVYIQTPYFVPDQAFLTAVKIAARSGVDVRIMIPGVPDKRYVYFTTMSYIGELLDAGVKVYLYNGFIHSKTITVDDSIVTVGSANTDIRSFSLLFEINAFIYDEENAKLSRGIFENDMNFCSLLTSEQYKKRGILKIILEGFFRLFSPIM